MLDEKDHKILEILKEGSEQTTRQIAKKTLLPITTVHNRIKKLKEEGIIKKYTIEIEEKKIGNKFSAILLVSCDYEELRKNKTNQHKLAKKLRELKEIREANIVTGTVDLVLKVKTTDVEAYDKFLFKKLQTIPGIHKTQTLVTMHEE